MYVTDLNSKVDHDLNDQCTLPDDGKTYIWLAQHYYIQPQSTNNIFKIHQSLQSGIIIKANSQTIHKFTTRVLLIPCLYYLLFVGQWLNNPVDILQAIKDSQQQWVAQQASYCDVAKVLEDNCRRLGLLFHGQTPLDGNCFFHAVSDQLDLQGLPSQSAIDLRRAVVTYLRANSTIQVHIDSYCFKAAHTPNGR